ncbi:MAG: hypothetical protein ACYC9L_08770 [Sulfuricaulis sp.]
MPSYTDLQRLKLEQFASTFLTLYVDDRYRIPQQFLTSLIECNPLIANFIACTSLVNTDPWIRILLEKKAPIEKLLPLYSQRNRIQIDKDLLFAPNPEAASLWYALQRLTLRYPVDPDHFQNAKRYFENFPSKYRIVSTDCIIAGYFAVTYLHSEYERQYKSWLMNIIQRDCERITPSGKPDKKSIALISAKWVYGSSVHRALYPYFKTLQGKYKLTLVNMGTGPLNEQIDTSLFSEVRYFPPLKDPRALSEEQRAAVTSQDWQIAYFPDVGMDAETIYLVSQRLAPIQIVGYGHPSSTWSSNADYFFVGKDVECAQGVENNFSEQLIQLPGIGMYAIWPPFPCPNGRPEKSNDSPIVINCPWTVFKLAAPLISTLKKMISRSDRKLLFRIFGGPGILGLSAYPIYKREILRALGKDNAEFPTPVMLEDYNREMAKGDITLISYPFGGFTTVIDSIHLGIPVITRCGNHGYNNFPAELLKNISWMSSLPIPKRNTSIKQLNSPMIQTICTSCVPCFFSLIDLRYYRGVLTELSSHEPSSMSLATTMHQKNCQENLLR